MSDEKNNTPIDFDFAEQLPVNTNKPPFHGNPQGAQTHEERVRTLASLPMVALSALLNDASKRMDTAWLQTAMVMGTFDFSREISRDGRALASLDALDQAMAFLSMCRNTACHTDPIHGNFSPPIEVPELKANPTWTAFFPHFAAHLIKEHNSVRDQLEHISSEPKHQQVEWWNSFERIQKTMGVMLIGACALGLPETARAIVTNVPASAIWDHGLNLLGGALKFAESVQKSPNEHVRRRFTPSFFAMQLSQIECVRAIQEAAGGAPLPMALFKEKAPYGRTQYSMPDTEVDVIGMLDAVAPMCRPYVFTDVLQARLADDRDTLAGGPNRHKLYDHAIEALNERGQRDGMGAGIASFVACGVYDMDPTKSVAKALEYANPQVLKSVAGEVDWARIFRPELETGHNSPFMRGLMVCTEDRMEQAHDEAMAYAINMAVKSGQTKHALFSMPETNGITSDDFCQQCGEFVAQPMAMLVKYNHQRAMLALLNAGLDAKNPLHRGTLSVLAMAETINPDLAHLIHSFEARKKSMALLGELEGANVPTKTNKGNAP